MGGVAGSRAFSGARTGISVCREYRDQNHPGTRRWIMTTMEAAPMGRHSLSAVLDDIVALPERIPLSLVQLMTRLAIGHVFWTSAQSKLASWPATLQLFAMEYRVPVLPPDVAASLATAAELSGSVLIVAGLLTRLAALQLLGVVMVIQLFVFPGNWAEHL